MVQAAHSRTDDADWDPPPPYEASTSSQWVDHSTNTFVQIPCPTAAVPELSSTSDGRVDVRVGSRFSRNLENILGDQPPDPLHAVEETFASPSISDVDFDLNLNIVVQVVGSRGDVQPFVALGAELRKHGHRVRLATHAIFEELVVGAGLEFFSIGGDPVELMSYMVRHPGLIPSMESLRAGDIQRKRASIKEILNGCWRSCLEPDQREGTPFVADAIIANPPSFAHIHCAQALGIPVHLMFTMPWTSTRAFPHPLANMKYNGSDPSVGNLISYHFVEWLTWQGLGDLINAWRKEALELDCIPATEGPNLAETLQVPFTYCWSSALIPKPQEWGAHIDLCGFFFREPVAYVPPPSLAEFLQSGPPPIYIGFGSIVLENMEATLKILLDAPKRTGVRAIIAKGWCHMQGEESPNIYYIDDCPHEWLFQRVAAVVHHGGAGTTACGLRNGKPTTIIPFFGDMVKATGAGPEPIPYKALTTEKLVDAITFCLEPTTAAVARRIGDQINQENGVRAAVNSFHAHLPRRDMECDLIPGEPAVWKFKKGRRIVKLSKIAAFKLKDQGRLQAKHLQRHGTKPLSIEVQRWEPVTAISSATLSTVAGMADAGAGVFIDPYREYRRLQTNTEATGVSVLEAEGSRTQEMPQNASTDQNDTSHAKQMALASGISLAKFLGRSSRGLFVEIPLAATEGMRAIPRLYGDKLHANAPVQDWRSGMAVGWSGFTHGVYEGFTDIFVHTYRGKKKRGSLGVAEGLSKGLVSLAVKTGSATIGLVAYPNQGIYRSLRSAMHKGSAQQIDEARWAEVWLLDTDRAARVDVEALCSRYDDLLSTRDSALHLWRR
ncbi:unnamed protein product [Penicillium salamii]|uniref:Glycosyltransferase family 28 N-terminal domain-containing protein n=1 Tax=Penicillium salamii TaxID=1612424 RepID=A0A9W4JW58_9EURO|nr:unnamed protein product [Penicillium salamii]CAG8396964.1 unnamed protein product [Penicillium salamii]CAG8416131.1 unnamed protein product [Penicillium salamii]CAG8421400.1 unnamed protein product [Penicillium salamii]